MVFLDLALVSWELFLQLFSSVGHSPSFLSPVNAHTCMYAPLCLRLIPCLHVFCGFRFNNPFLLWAWIFLPAKL